MTRKLICLPRLKRITALGLLLAATAGTGLAQTSPYNSMTLVANWQDFNPGANNMVLISNNLWQADLFIAARNQSRFKFAANGNFNVNWGQNNTSFTTLPYTNTAELNQADIIHNQLRDGYYRFTFNDQTRVYTVSEVDLALYSNRVRNASFELEGEDESKPRHWQINQPDSFGDLFGNVGRADWRSRTGDWIAYIGAGDFNWGGFWHDIPAGRGYDYEISAWFWADVNPPFGPWTAQTKEMKVEFFDAKRSGPIATQSIPIDDLAQEWRQASFTISAPEQAAWARLVIFANDIGQLGSLQIDDVSMKEIPRRNQSFNWSFAQNVGNHNYGGWSVTNSFITANTNLVRTSYSLAMQTNAVMTSPRIEGGIGRVTFFHRNYNNEVEGTTNAVSLQLQRSFNGSAWESAGSITNILNQFYQPATFLINDPNVKFIRILKTSGNENLLIDDVVIEPINPVLRAQDFTDWTGFTANGCYLSNGWNLCTGRVSADGVATILGEEETTNSLRSPLFTNGFGTISFDYARGTNGTAPVQLHLQISTDDTTWETIDTLPSITSGGFSTYETFYFRSTPYYVRIANVPLSGEVSGDLILDEQFNGGSTPPPGWEFTGISTYTSISSSGRNPPSLRFDNTGEQVVTAVVNNPTNLQFSMKGQSINAASSFLVEQLIGATWTQIANYTSIGNSWRTESLAVSSNATRFRWTYTKVSGNLAFDDVIIMGIPSSETPPPQDLLIDNVVIGQPFEYRTQNFDSWPAKNSYSGTSIHQGWSVFNSIVNSDNADVGQAARFQRSQGQAFAQSHFFPDGIGPISFRHRIWPGDNAATLLIETSVNGENWDYLDEVVVSSSEYVDYAKFYAITNGAYVRFNAPSPGGRILLDQIFVDRLREPADVALTGFISPSAPFTNDAVTVRAQAIPTFGAKDIDVTAYYRIGESGPFTALTMGIDDFITFSANDVIPAQPPGTIVQYYLEAEFGGAGSELTSPRSWPAGGSNNPAWYGIPNQAPGKVKFNELQYEDFFNFFPEEEVPAFVEIIGPEGFDLSNWSIEFFGQSTRVALYTITNNPVLANQDSGFGFWVLGNEFTIQRDQTMTNLFADHFVFGIRLLNEMGGVEDAVSVNGTLNQFTRLPGTLLALDGSESLSLVGSGDLSNQIWVVTNVSPGAVNQGQDLGEGPTEPEAWLVQMTMGADITMRTAGNPDNWSAAPYYTTNLRAVPQAWQPVTPFNSSYAGGTNTIWFTRPTGLTNVVYRIQFTAP